MRNRRLLPALCTVLVWMSMQGVLLLAEEHKTVIDMCGNRVEVPVSPKRIAVAHCVSAEKIMTLGYGSSIAMMSQQSPWAYRLFPEIRSAQAFSGVTPEQMKNQKVDFVLFTPGMTKRDPYSAAGLKTVCAFSAEKRPRKLEEFVPSFQEQVTLFGNLLGPDARAKADRYNAYLEKKVNQILAVTSRLDRNHRPSVYYGGLSSSMLNSQGDGSVMHWNTEIAGGNYLPRVLDENHAKATVKQVVSWNPDIILVSGLSDSIDIALKNPDLARLKAVKDGKVYHLPMGIYAWDHASNENVLLMIYLAKLFHPDMFKDWDMVKEMKTFYREVYGKAISDEDAKRILGHLPPA